MGDTICDWERGRPLGMSTVRLSRRDSRLDECLLEECLEELDDFSLLDVCLDDELDLDEDLDFSLGTSRMFRTRPVVGSVVESCPGSWET